MAIRGEGTDAYHFILPVWGEKFVSLYLTYTLPSHLSRGNLPSFPREKATYHIFTRQEDVAQTAGLAGLSQAGSAREGCCRHFQSRSRRRPASFLQSLWLDDPVL